jgi:hypothetical protein
MTRDLATGSSARLCLLGKLSNQELMGTASKEIWPSVSANAYVDRLNPVIVEMVDPDPWFRAVDIGEAGTIILSFPHKRVSIGQRFRVEWPAFARFFMSTKLQSLGLFSKIEDDAADFVEQHELRASFTWLQSAAPRFFPAADFGVSVVSAENDEERLLALCIYDCLNPVEFRQRRHALCRAMQEMGHRTLYRLTSIFQRRGPGHGRPIVSWYSSLSEL